METFDASQTTDIKQKENNGISHIRCTYDVKDITSEIQIMNYRSENYTNEEIGSKIKILNDGKKEELIFKKKFDNLGINTVEFIIEENITNLSYLFYRCYSLKTVNFFFI